MDAERQMEPNLFEDFVPKDFAFSPAQATWEPPCWIKVWLRFEAITETAKEVFWLPRRFEFQVDPFKKQPVEEQLGTQFWQLYDQPGGHRIMWKEFLWNQHEDFCKALTDKSNLFQFPMKFVPRSQFERTALDTVLAQNPETMEIYLADDTDSYKSEITALRIHSSLWHYSPDQRYLWFEKKVPWRLQNDDVIPWFYATIKKLPNKKQPLDCASWAEKLLHQYPECHANSNDRPKLTLLFGSKDDVGYVAMYPLDRQHVHSIIRDGNEIRIKATIENPYEKNPENLWWTFHLFTPSPFHAQRLESRLTSEEEVRFGIGDDISGMISIHDEYVTSINVEPNTLKKHCARKGMVLVSFSAQRYKHKSYSYWPANRALPEDVTDVL